MRQLVFILICFSFFSLRAQPKAQRVDSAHIRLDSSKVEIRKIDQKAVTTYSKQKEFIYDDVAPETLNWWDRFWNGLWKFLERLFAGKSASPGSSPKLLMVILKYVLLAVAIAIVVFAIFKLLKLNLKIFAKKSKEITVPYEESLENIHEINFDEQLETALQNENYRLAVRLLYLQTLKHLTDRELINWMSEKTNQTYVQELENLPQQAQFAKLTEQFEYIWYGEFYIDKQVFEPIHQLFSQFNQQLR